MTGVRPLHEVDDPRLLDEIASVRSFAEKTLTEPSCDELDVVFWKDEDGMLKMTLRGPRPRGSSGKVFNR
jgi:hypothetical protein